MKAILAVMGVSASGKTTLARALAETLGWPFQEGDDLHPAANVAQMRGGHALDDADRAPWLAAVSRWIGDRQDRSEPGVITCSALKRAYRDALREGHPSLRFVFLRASADVLARRSAGRTGHFMPPGLLDSQLRTLEPPDADEPVLTVDATAPIDDQRRLVLSWLREERQASLS
jgi:gluconokinase